ncbi:MAG: pyruvate kinase [Cyclobacteriaceae bacterium]|nr:pyruvate kinase [Cyclobacteriaceae bacterium]
MDITPTHQVGLVEELKSIAFKMVQNETESQSIITQVHPNHVQSAINFIHYLTLRSHDIRDIQEKLHILGLSSFTSSESHTKAQLNKVIRWMQPDFVDHIDICDFEKATTIVQRNKINLFGKHFQVEMPHIMVTLNGADAGNFKLFENFLEAGMTVARINCAHDNEEVWLSLIETLQKATMRCGKTCKIYMDLAGPKIRIKSIWKKGSLAEAIHLTEGESLRVCCAENIPQPWQNQSEIVLVVEPAEIIDAIHEGERIFFDDGKFEAIVKKKGEYHAQIEIINIATKKPQLKIEKGMNIPDSVLPIPALTSEDKKNLSFVCKHADLVGFSFVGNEDDLLSLQAEINQYKTQSKPAIILKIERLDAIKNLPVLLLTAMREERAGVMIARGDLAVEIGFERLSEIQEEILWLCEAAHVPVIWATQVLENMNKTGYATRSEITDAAMAVKAECVMLNKGKFVSKTIHTLSNILSRQVSHFDKKRYTFRPLNIAKQFFHKANVE